MTDDMNKIRDILGGKNDLQAEWATRQQVVIDAFAETVVELKDSGRQGFSALLPDGRVLLGLTEPPDRPCLLMGPTGTSAGLVEVAWGSTLDYGEGAPPAIKAGAEVQNSHEVDRIDRSLVLETIAWFLSNNISVS